uniref:Uncharacterized protein n=1 Tax=Equus asinus TaxID=9793 RepID=A0A9L0K9U1_EQUAS
MGKQVLFWVSLSFSSLGIMDCGITQSPKSLIREEGEDGAMYWYLQDPEPGLRLIYYLQVVNAVQKGDSASWERKNQTALHFCASNRDTVKHCHLLSVHKCVPSPASHQMAGFSRLITLICQLSSTSTRPPRQLLPSTCFVEWNGHQ